MKSCIVVFVLVNRLAVFHPPHLFSAEPEGIQLGVRRHEYKPLVGLLLSIRDSSDTAAATDFYEKSKRNRIQSVTSKSYMGLIATRRFRRIIVNSY